MATAEQVKWLVKAYVDHDDEKFKTVALQIAAQKYEQCLRECKRIPSEMCPATTVHNLVGEIIRKVDKS